MKWFLKFITGSASSWALADGRTGAELRVISKSPRPGFIYTTGSWKLGLPKLSSSVSKFWMDARTDRTPMCWKFSHGNWNG